VTPWLFVLFAVAVIGWFGLQLIGALLALRNLRGGTATEIDMEYVRVPNFLAREVREGRTASMLADDRVPALPRMQGTLRCESDCAVLEDARVTAIVAEGKLTLKEGVHIGEFADSRGEMIIGDECRIGGSATSETAVRMGRRVTLRSTFAPEITTGGVVAVKRDGASPSEMICIPDETFGGALKKLSEDTWLHRGSLKAERPLTVTCKLIVLGSLTAPAGSVLQDDVKTSGNLIFGEGCVCGGALVSDRDIELGSGSRFSRSVYAAGEVRLKDGVCGEGSDPVAVFGRSRVLLEQNILVRGRIASEGSVISA
jgi:NDP-sugar pyrophosphorylase family protein